MTFSGLTVQDAADYLREEPDTPLLSEMLAAAKRYVLDYTGLTEEQAEGHEDLCIAALSVCADFYDRRSAAVPGVISENPLVTQILGAHGRNLL